MTEMFDMKQAGAVAFTDDKHPVMDLGTDVAGIVVCKKY